MTASITELKKHPMAAVKSAEGEALAILNRNEPVFYCVPAQRYEAMMDALEDVYWLQIIKEREHERGVKVNLDDL
jgi:antitoxin StbD